MTEYRDGHPKYQILPPEERLRPPAETRVTVPAGYNFSGVQTGWLSRHRGRKLGRALEEQAGGLQVAKRWAEAAAGFETARQQLELVRARRALLPALLEEEKLRVEADIARARGELQAATALYADHRAQRAERRELEAGTHAVEMARARRALLEEQISIRRLEDVLKDGAGTRSDSTPAPDDPLSDYLKTEQEVRHARSAASRVADAIRSAAAAEGRPLTRQEAELVEMYESAAAAAEANIRRGGAADF
jgi:hypothetical protein